MAYFAQLDDSNIVLQVLAIENSDILDGDGNESEAMGVALCRSFVGASTNWKQTSYNHRRRGTYAGVGYSYDPAQDIFTQPKPDGCDSWTYNLVKRRWEAPVTYPNQNEHGDDIAAPPFYTWDEDNRRWNQETE
jgi:hypothetical protein